MSANAEIRRRILDNANAILVKAIEAETDEQTELLMSDYRRFKGMLEQIAGLPIGEVDPIEELKIELGLVAA